MRADAKEPKPLGGTWAPAFGGAAGTVAAMLFAFLRIGIDPEWETLFKAVAIAQRGLV
jgi:hypothetical protein